MPGARRHWGGLPLHRGHLRAQGGGLPLHSDHFPAQWGGRGGTNARRTAPLGRPPRSIPRSIPPCCMHENPSFHSGPPIDDYSTLKLRLSDLSSGTRNTCSLQAAACYPAKPTECLQNAYRMPTEWPGTQIAQPELKNAVIVDPRAAMER